MQGYGLNHKIVKLWIEIKMNRDAINCFGSQESEAVDC
jgi:hypothetical protein